MSGVCVHVDTTVVLSVSYSTDTHTKSAYDTIRDAILTCAQKLTSQLNLPYGTNSKKVENRKLKTKKRICSEVSVNSPGNPWSQSV